MKTDPLTPEMLHKMDAHRRAANYLSVGQIYLYDNPLLKRTLMLADVEHGTRTTPFGKQLEGSMKSYKAEELFDEHGRLMPELAPKGERTHGGVYL